MNEQEYHARLCEFRGPLVEVLHNNSAVYNIATAYALGSIITKEEALSQMVVALAKDWTEEQHRALNSMLSFGMKVI